MAFSQQYAAGALLSANPQTDIRPFTGVPEQEVVEANLDLLSEVQRFEVSKDDMIKKDKCNYAAITQEQEQLGRGQSAADSIIMTSQKHAILKGAAYPQDSNSKFTNELVPVSDKSIPSYEHTDDISFQEGMQPLIPASPPHAPIMQSHAISMAHFTGELKIAIANNVAVYHMHKYRNHNWLHSLIKHLAVSTINWIFSRPQFGVFFT